MFAIIEGNFICKDYILSTNDLYVFLAEYVDNTTYSGRL